MSNDGKTTKSGNRIKSHLKIIIPLIIAIVAVIVLACTIPACIKAKPNGKYYKITGGELDRETYIVLNSGKWSNEVDEGGTYEIDGEKITFYEEFFGETDVSVGTFKNYVITLEGNGRYISEKHKHSYGEWETESEASCANKGVKHRNCDCGYNDTEYIPAKEHDVFFNFDETEHWNECRVCGENTTEKSAHNGTECTVCGYPLHYTLYDENESYKISGVMSGLTEVVIPSSFNNLPVTEIGNDAFKDCGNLTSIRYKGDIASWCQISTVCNLMQKCSKNTKLYIDGNEITGNLIIPDGVTYIESCAFYNCSGLTSVTIPDSVISLREDAFYGCDKLIRSEDGVQYVNNWVIGCENYLTQINLKDGTKGIASSAFSSEYLTRITIPDSVTYISDYAFRYCTGITSITIPDSVTHIGSFAFYGCSSLTSLIMPDSVTYIGEFAFEDCYELRFNEYNNALYLGNGSNPYVVLVKAQNENITNLTVNENTKIIYTCAFAYCEKLTEITIPDGVTSICAGAFQNCRRMTTITIPDSVISIGIYAFGDCHNLYDINFKGTKKQWAAIEKGAGWNYATHCDINCTDGIYDYQD